MVLLKLPGYQQEQRLLEGLPLLNYQTDTLDNYLQRLVTGIRKFIVVDWCVLALSDNGSEQIRASTLVEIETSVSVSSSLRLLFRRVVESGCPCLENIAVSRKPIKTEGYQAYLGVPLRTPAGEVIGALLFFHRQPRHFTAEEVQLAEIFAERAAIAIDHHRLYHQQQSNQEKLKTLEHLAEIGESTAMVVHESRNALTTILMGLNFFKRINLSQQCQARLALALQEAKRLQHFLDDILVYAKTPKLQCLPLDLNLLIEELVDSFHTLPSARGRKIRLSSTTNRARVLGDQDKLKQVFVNLLVNACEAVVEGEVITCQIERVETAGLVVVQVHNHGKSIPLSMLPQVVKPFYTTKPSGTGLGLAIVKRIVEAHSGELAIKSSVTAGTTVTVQLPFIA